MELPKRKPTRLKGYDHSVPGAYFITICTQNREHLFEIENVGNDLCVVPRLLKSFNKRLFQKSFHDHIIRGEKDYQKIWEYIDTNVIRWEKDCFYNSETEQWISLLRLLSFRVHLLREVFLLH